MPETKLSQDEIDFDFEPRIVQEAHPEVEGTLEPPMAQVSASNEPGSHAQPILEPPESGNRKGEPEQIALLNLPEWWEEHWRGMPEFKQKDFMPYKTIYVHFETKADMERFAKLVEQTVLITTKSIWYPEAQMAEVAKLRWIANPEVDNGKKEELREILDGE